MRVSMDRDCRGSTRARRQFIPILVTAALVLTLPGCGGGGGSGSSQSNSSGVTMSVTPLNISVSATTTQSAPSSSFSVDFSGLSQVQEVYVGAQDSGQGIDHIINNGGTLPAAVTIQFDSPADLQPGTYDGTVRVEGCLDQACTQPAGNSPQTVQVHYTVTKSTFAVVGLSPSSDYAGAQSFTLRVNGSTFTPQSTILWNGTQLDSTYVNSSQLTAQVPATDIATAGNIMVSVSDPTNGTTNTQTFTIKGSSLTLKSLSPASVTVGSSGFSLTVTGTGFTPQSAVFWNGNPQPTTFVSATQITTTIPASDIAVTGSDSISVNDPTYGTSSSQTFTVAPTPLALKSLSPVTVAAGGSSFMLTVLGTAFTGTSVIEWNGAALPTTMVSSTELIAHVPASNISTTGSALVTVSDPNSPPGTTGAQTVTIAAPSIDAVAYQINPAHTGAVTFKTVSSTFPSAPTWSVDVGGTPSYALIVDGKVIVTVQISGGSNSELLALDQKTGKTVWGPISVNDAETATYDGGKVFILSGSIAEAPTLGAYDVNTGSLDWSTRLSGYSVYTGLSAAADGTLYVICDGVLDAFNESSGVPLWTQVVSGTDLSPAVTVDGVYMSYGCYVADYRPATGERIWYYDAGCSGGGIGMPVIANQLDYSIGDIFDAETGASEGTYPASSWPALSNSMGYFLSSGALSGVALSDNTVKWTFTGDGTLDGAPLAVNQYVFIGSSSGNLYGLDGATGNQVWSVNLGTAIDTNQIFSSPFSGLAAGDGLLVVPAGTTVTAYTLSTNP